VRQARVAGAVEKDERVVARVKVGVAPVKAVRVKVGAVPAKAGAVPAKAGVVPVKADRVKAGRVAAPVRVAVVVAEKHRRAIRCNWVAGLRGSEVAG
jgi:hypothetical protein